VFEYLYLPYTLIRLAIYISLVICSTIALRPVVRLLMIFVVCVVVWSSAIMMLVSCWCHGHLLWLDVNGCVLPIPIYDLHISSVVK
jgi:hypothetical protein